MKNIRESSFQSLDEFKTILGEASLVFFHIFEGIPEVNVMIFFEALSQDELLILLDVEKDEGFLKKTPVVVEVTAPPRQFISKPLVELRGLGGWAKGTLIGVETNKEEIFKLHKKGERVCIRR